MRDSVLIIDGNSLMHRAFHALPPMDADGVQTNAVHGFMMMLLRVMQQEAPRYCVTAFDEHAPTFRHTAYADYKAGRAPTPDDLRQQFPIIKEILTAMGLGVLSLAGYEADDLLGTLSAKCGENGLQAILLTGDRDALQLVNDDVKMIFTRKGISEAVHFTPSLVFETYGVRPCQVTDWKGLMGDSSDNIPGVPGVGEKTAVKLLSEYQTLENVLSNAKDIKGKLGERLRDNMESARFSKELATIVTTAPVALDLPAWRTDRMANGLAALQTYKLAGVAQRLRELCALSDANQAPTAPAQSEYGDFETLTTPESIMAFIHENDPCALHITQDDMTLAGEKRRARVGLARDLLTFGMLPQDALSACAPLFSRGVIAHDGKRLMHLAGENGLAQPNILWDTMLGAYLHNPQEKNYQLSQFAADDASGVYTLYALQKTQLKAEGTEKLFFEVEMPLSRVLFDMEREGFRVDADVLTALGEQLTARADELKEEIYQAVGERGFNLNSTQQLGVILFEKLGLPSGRKTQRGYSTDADTLEGLVDLHPCIAPILEYRQVVKLNGTYIDALKRKMDASGRVHTYFDQTGTATGRISSSEPNLQNIPVRTKLGREIRRAFIARDGWVLADADYSQIELRILAHFSGDEAMTDAFRSGQDVHTRTAAEVGGVPMSQVTPEMRSAAKAVNFGLVYGISDFGLARNIGISRYDASSFIKRYFERYPRVERYMKDAVRLGVERGYAETLMGRRRLLPELSAKNANLRKFGERVAMNMPIQGTAADIIKLAMVRVHEALQKEGLRARLILQVHDELLIEAPRDERERVQALLRSCMEQVIHLDVPLLCDIKTGNTWYETK